MELDKIGAELGHLSVMVEGWKVASRIDDLERDLALEKLRRIYEAVRFAASVEQNTVPENESTVEIPVNLDLDRMLGIIPLAEEESGESVPAPQMAEEPKGAEFSMKIGAGELLRESEAAVSPAPERGESVVPPEFAAAPQEAVVSLPEPSVAAEPQVVFEPVRESVPEPPFESVPEPAPSLPAAGRQTVVEPALFGMDEIVQHKRKQRVIMSLYDEHPGTSRPAEPAAKPETSPRKEPVRKESEAVGEPFRASEPVSEPARIPEAEPETQPEMKTESAPPATETVNEAESNAAVQTPASGAVLGEVINRGIQTLGETIAPPCDTVSDMAHKAPVADLREAIGINDRFLLIRDLFDGDAAACDAAIDTLNGFTDLDDCMLHIAEHYAWNPNSDGARLLVELLERKLA